MVEKINYDADVVPEEDVIKNLHRDQKIVELATEHPEMSYEEIGRQFGLTRARVSQICLKAKVIRRPNDISEENWKEKWEATKLEA